MKECVAFFSFSFQNEKCRFNKSDVGADTTGYVDVKSGDEDALKMAVATVGPISVAIDALHSSFMMYKDGVYVEPDCSTTFLDHGVLAVGYGTTEEGQDYWLVKNRLVISFHPSVLWLVCACPHMDWVSFSSPYIHVHKWMYLYIFQGVLLSHSVCISFIFKVGFWVSVFSSVRSSISGALYDLYLSIFLTRSDGGVNEKGQGTLCDAYSKQHACNSVQSWAQLFKARLSLSWISWNFNCYLFAIKGGFFSWLGSEEKKFASYNVIGPQFCGKSSFNGK